MALLSVNTLCGGAHHVLAETGTIFDAAATPVLRCEDCGHNAPNDSHHASHNYCYRLLYSGWCLGSQIASAVCDVRGRQDETRRNLSPSKVKPEGGFAVSGGKILPAPDPPSGPTLTTQFAGCDFMSISKRDVSREVESVSAPRFRQYGRC